LEFEQREISMAVDKVYKVDKVDAVEAIISRHDGDHLNY